MTMQYRLGAALLGLALAVPTAADEWRTPHALPAGRAVQLGAPTKKAAQATQSPPIITVRAQDAKDAAVTPAGWFGGGVRSEEDYNSGVVGGGGSYGQPWFSGVSMEGFGNPLGGPITFRSDDQFRNFMVPVTNPFLFEPPWSLTEVRPIFMYQKAPTENPLLRGGDIQAYMLQGRLALNERFSFVVHKLGFLAIEPDGAGPFVADDAVGFSEVWLGPKYVLYRDPQRQTVAAIGANFELGVGDGDVGQGTGSGGVTPYLSVGQAICLGRGVGDLHVLAGAGYRFAFDSDRSESGFLSLHVDYDLLGLRLVYPLVELNWYHYANNGAARVASFEGQDLFNLGSTNVSGNDVLTLALGLRLRLLHEWIHAGFAYEFPISNREDLLDYRITLDVSFRF